MITYRTDIRPAAAKVAALYHAVDLLRPVDDLERLQRMLDGSSYLLTAWDGERLVAILRGWTDGAYDGYICELAVDPAYGSWGVGRQMLRQTTALDPRIQWVFRSSRQARDYYLHVGWQRIDNGWYWPRKA